ncbi:MAG TPA: pyridoxamine 5'-phosphate oxidase [Candidatus Tumulicola sp.]|jgi:pyridoxamine 5'-phosphate oxidase
MNADMPCVDPASLLRGWIADAAAAGINEPSAMCLATVGPGSRPSARFVLLRGLDERGLRFYTSYFSRKGREIGENPAVAALFAWPPLERQARVEGSARALSEAESDAYFSARPRGHQLAAWASEQSEPLDSRITLEERFAHFDARFEGQPVPRPHSWGGYLIVPERFEFWQARPNRLHDRLEYVREDGVWRAGRLQP